MQRDGASNYKIDDRIRDIGEIPEHTKGLAPQIHKLLDLCGGEGFKIGIPHLSISHLNDLFILPQNLIPTKIEQ